MDDKIIKVVNEARWIDGQNVRNRLDDITYNPMRSQEEFVMRLMRENAKTEYGRKHGFKHIRNISDFKLALPLTSYEDYTYVPEFIQDVWYLQLQMADPANRTAEKAPSIRNHKRFADALRFLKARAMLDSSIDYVDYWK